MEKKPVIIEILFVVIASLFIGSIGGGSLFAGNFNIIDEGQFAAWANHMLHGKLMYQDIYITYGPFFVYPLFLLSKVFGSSLFLVRLYLLIGSIAGILVSLLIMYKLKIPSLIRFVVLFLMILLPVMQLRQASVLFALYCLFQTIDTRDKRWAFLTGITTATSFFVSPDMGLFMILIELFTACFVISFSNNFKNQIRLFATAILGFLVPTVIFSIWASREGWLDSYITVTLDLLFSFSGINLPNGMGFPNLFLLKPNTLDILSWMKFILSRESLLYFGVLFYIVTFIYTVMMILRDGSIAKIKEVFLLALLGLCMYSILIGRWGLGHFFFVLSPILILSGYFAAELLKLKQAKKGNAIAVAILLVVICTFGIRLILINRPQILANLAELPKVRLGNVHSSEKQQMYFNDIQSFVKTQTKAGDNIYIVSNEPALYMLTDRTNPTRYDLPYIVITKAKRLEVLADLEKEPPEYVFENSEDWPVDGITNRQRMPEVSTFLKDNYSRYKKINSMIVYKYNG